MKRVPDLIDVWVRQRHAVCTMAFPVWNREPSNRISRLILLQKVLTRQEAGSIPSCTGQFTAQRISWRRTKKTGSGINPKWNNQDRRLAFAYKTVVGNGLVLDKAGNKMSKTPWQRGGSFQNHRYLWCRCHPLVPDHQCIPMGQSEVWWRRHQRSTTQVLGTLYNTHQFFALYANVDGFAFKEAYIPEGKARDRSMDTFFTNSLVKPLQKILMRTSLQAGRASKICGCTSVTGM